MIACRWLKLLVMALVSLCIGACAYVGDRNAPTAKVGSSVREADQPRVLIVYQTKYGSTRQYAEWLHKDILSDLVRADKADKTEFSRYDVIVFGSYIRMGQIGIAPLIVETRDALKGKKVILFTTSGTPPSHPNILRMYLSNLPEEIRKGIKYFPLRGKMLSKDLGFFDKFLVAVGRIMERDESLRIVMAEDFDGVKPENLIPVLEYIKTPLLPKEKSIESANP
jgi:menaquinone-dependent protoporphyrinogen IX oxidase